MEDVEGLDSDNTPFLRLAIQEVRQTVSDAIYGVIGMPEQEMELEGSDQ
jgi:hypothetical protein